MTIRRVTSPDVPEPPPERWSNCLVSDGIAYVSGMTARGTDPKVLAGMDEYEQAKQIFGKIKGMVEAAGGAMADVVKVTIYVTNIKNNTKVWAARREFFTGDFPASTLVEVSALAAPEILVEIEAIAHIGKCVNPGSVSPAPASARSRTTTRVGCGPASGWPWRPCCPWS
jgi:2-iminobutanoate/2-iminopropanoate deaminase